LLRGWDSPKAGMVFVRWTGYLLCLIAGLGLLVYTGIHAVRQRAQELSGAARARHEPTARRGGIRLAKLS